VKFSDDADDRLKERALAAAADTLEECKRVLVRLPCERVSGEPLQIRNQLVIIVGDLGEEFLPLRNPRACRASPRLPS
jgi:hypothetical protein